MMKCRELGFAIVARGWIRGDACVRASMLRVKRVLAREVERETALEFIQWYIF